MLGPMFPKPYAIIQFMLREHWISRCPWNGIENVFCLSRLIGWNRLILVASQRHCSSLTSAPYTRKQLTISWCNTKLKIWMSVYWLLGPYCAVEGCSQCVGCSSQNIITWHRMQTPGSSSTHLIHTLAHYTRCFLGWTWVAHLNMLCDCYKTLKRFL